MKNKESGLIRHGRYREICRKAKNQELNEEFFEKVDKCKHSLGAFSKVGTLEEKIAMVND
jgi:hypothetical protein